MRTRLFGATWVLATVGCASDPVYLPSPMIVEAGMPGDMGMLVEGRSSLLLPILLETDEDRIEREQQQALLDPAIEIPYVKLGDLEVQVEWTIKNLEDREGKATIALNGANQFYAYDPSLFVVSADDEAPETPGLAGDIPLPLAPLGQRSGVFTEDELREASIDLDQITRGNINPFRARLTISKHAESFEQLSPPTFDANGEPVPPTPTGLVFPRATFAQMLRIDLVFKPDRHMVLEYTVRVRDMRGGLVHELGVDALTDPAAMAELEPFDPASYAFAPP